MQTLSVLLRGKRHDGSIPVLILHFDRSHHLQFLCPVDIDDKRTCCLRQVCWSLQVRVDDGNDLGSIDVLEPLDVLQQLPAAAMKRQLIDQLGDT